jgi:hypothetical protein
MVSLQLITNLETVVLDRFVTVPNAQIISSFDFRIKGPQFNEILCEATARLGDAEGHISRCLSIRQTHRETLKRSCVPNKLK